MKDRQNGGESVSFKEVLDEVRYRDEKDMTRKLSPLKQAEDAILVETDELGVDEVVDFINGKLKLE